MTMSRRTYFVLGMVAMIAVAAIGAVVATGINASGGGSGQIDDGAELLDQASITLEEAIAAAQAAYDGGVGEIDLEFYQGQLVFNVDIGRYDVKVDASDGTVLGQETDDDGDTEDDDDQDDD